MWGKSKLKVKIKDNTGNLQNMPVSGSGNCTFLKIYWAGKHQKGAISGPGNLQKGTISGGWNWHFLKNSLQHKI